MKKYKKNINNENSKCLHSDTNGIDIFLTKKKRIKRERKTEQFKSRDIFTCRNTNRKQKFNYYKDLVRAILEFDLTVFLVREKK